jgi:hypothetical protein
LQKGKPLSQRLKRCATQNRVFQQTVKPGCFLCFGGTAERGFGKTQSSKEATTTGAEARADFTGLRGPEEPLFHGKAAHL